MPTATQRRTSLFQMPDEYIIADFTLVIERLNKTEGDNLSLDFRNRIVKEFNKQYPLLNNFFDLVVEETEVWEGSRKSKNKIVLKKKGKKDKKGGRTFLGKLLNSAIISWGLLGTDPAMVIKNVEVIVERVEKTFQIEGLNISVLDYRKFPFDPETQQPEAD